MATKSFREESKIHYHGTQIDGLATLEQINCGSLQRIADATEKMAQNFLALEKDRDTWKRRYEDTNRYWDQAIDENRKKDLVIRSLRGVITRMKNQSVTRKGENR